MKSDILPITLCPSFWQLPEEVFFSPETVAWLCFENRNRLMAQFFIQLVCKLYLRIWILLFGLFEVNENFLQSWGFFHGQAKSQIRFSLFYSVRTNKLITIKWDNLNSILALNYTCLVQNRLKTQVFGCECKKKSCSINQLYIKLGLVASILNGISPFF